MKPSCDNPVTLRALRVAPQSPGADGFGMIEFLVALLLFATVIAAMLMAQLSAGRLATEALDQSVANVLARDMLDSIVANAAQLPAYEVELSADDSVDEVSPAADCAVTRCTPGQVAAYDILRWQRQLIGVSSQQSGRAVGGLSASRACIVSSGGVVTVAIAWRARFPLRASGAPDCVMPGPGVYDAQGFSAGNGLLGRQVQLSTYLGSFPG